MPSTAPLLFSSEEKRLLAFGKRLRLARLRRKLSAEIVAKRSDISRQTLVKVERGDPSVTFGTYLRVLAIYGLEADFDSVAADDKLGRTLQDLALTMSKRIGK